MIKWFKKKKKKGKVDIDQDIEPLEAPIEEPEDIGAPGDLAPLPAEPTAPVSGAESSWQAALDLAGEPDDSVLTAPADQDTSLSPETDLEFLPQAEADEEISPQKRRLFKKLRERLTRTRKVLGSNLDRLFLGQREIDLALLDELEELLISADLGVETSLELIERTREKVRRRELTNPARLKAHLKSEMMDLLSQVKEPKIAAQVKPRVIMVIGVNGVGKTTTIAKLAHYDRERGKDVLLVAADTFRAAAVEQLDIWGQRVGVPVIKQKTGSDPAAVVFDGLSAALSRGVDTVYIDTAGRLHTKVNLMEELKKVRRTADKQISGAPHEVLLVLDATTGQNAINQARLFHEAIGITGIVMTKLDGTAKGGVAVGVVKETGLPLKFIGVGEQMDDLRPFDPEAYLEAIL
jgi:fused signal recognition particle receptor